ncbi:metallophosphoesterase [Rhizobium rhizogenes]|uniref:metallophosphoesterase family protein n=1 Tax=Rhizobium rhizogenes TaxID=359 RepID=UPI003ECF8ECA
MISDVLDRAFVLREATRIHETLKGSWKTGRRGGGAHPEAIEPEITEALRFSIVKEVGRSGQQSAGSRRGAAPVSATREPYISSDPIISIVQSALELYLQDPHTVDTVELDTTSPAVTDRRAAKKRSGRRVFEQFSVTDIGWVSSVVAMGIRKFKDKRPFNMSPAQDLKIADNCRVVIVGDWGSGIPRAQKVAMEMRKHVVDAKNQGIECHVVHLGDVYYSGFEFEYRDRFLPYWPVHPTEADAVRSWCLNGNHDMYSGGYAYFDYLLADPRFARQEQSSFFRLSNKHWQILGLDTAWDDDGLKDPQDAWVRDKVANNPQKTMIMSHHQLFSARENSPDVGKVMRTKLKDVLDAKKIDVAIWGHEHRFVTYEPHDNIKYGRLIGHGGVPVWADTGPLAAPGIFQSTKSMGGGVKERFAYMGFAVLDFAGASIEALYYDEDGGLDLKEVLD